MKCSERKLFFILLSWIALTLVIVGFYKTFNTSRFFVDVVRKQKEAAESLSIRTKAKKEAAESLPIRTQAKKEAAPTSRIPLIVLNTFNETTTDDGCQGFNNDPRHPMIAKYFQPQETINCTGGYPNLLYADKNGERLIFDREKSKKLGIAVDYCRYLSLTRRIGNDRDIITSQWSKAFTESITVPQNVDHFLGQCLRGNKSTVVAHGYVSIIRVNKDKEKTYEERYNKHVANNKPKETLSVMLIGIDGTSKQNFARQMPKTKAYLLKEMGAIEMMKLNKVGLNTFPNVLALLSGISEVEIRRKWNDQIFFDAIDDKFMWSDAQKIGYRTSMILDNVIITSFHHLKKGWNKPNFDYYYRPVIISTPKDKYVRKISSVCNGDRPEISVYYDYWLQMAATFNKKNKPYFGYSFFAHLTHDHINNANKGDAVYLQLFQTFMNRNLLTNTLMVFFSDHGARYGELRSTLRGLQEDNNPFMFFVFPPWFKEKYPKIMDNFHKNQHRLITNYNVHATLKDILNFQGDDIAKREVPKSRAISLFQELPKKRTCEEAGIPIQFCNCQTRTSMEVSSHLSLKLSKSFLDHVVSKTKTLREKCVVLNLNATMSVLTMYTTSGPYNFYQMIIKTMPGGALYEASLKYNRGNKHDMGVVGDVARVNMYRGQADCVDDARTRPFCYCRNLFNKQG